MSTLKLNIGGTSYYLSRKNLLKFPDSKLGHFLALSHEERLRECDDYFQETQEYYFDRSPFLFNTISDMYRDCEPVSQLEGKYVMRLTKELDYWGPWGNLITSSEQERRPRTIRDRIRHDTDGEKPYWKILRMKLWLYLEDPFSSMFALIYAAITLFFILMTIAILLTTSLPQYRISQATCEYQILANRTSNDSTPYCDIWAIKQLARADAVCVAWFTLDFILRILATPNLLEFVRNPMNIIDFVAIFPFYVELVFYLTGVTFGTHSTGARRAIMVLRALRIGRIMKLGRYFAGLEVLAKALMKSLRELAILFLFVGMLVLFLATITFYVEEEQPDTLFVSIPAAAWWAIVTVTTVGYGDMIPQTIPGKCLGSVASILGIVVLAFPISIIVDNCRKAYDEMVNSEEKNARKSARDLLQSLKSPTPVQRKAASNPTELSSQI